MLNRAGSKAERWRSSDSGDVMTTLAMTRAGKPTPYQLLGASTVRLIERKASGLSSWHLAPRATVRSGAGRLLRRVTPNLRGEPDEDQRDCQREACPGENTRIVQALPPAEAPQPQQDDR